MVSRVAQSVWKAKERQQPRALGAGSRPCGFLAILAILFGFTLVGCAASERYVWFHELPESGAQLEYVIDMGDMLDVRVYDQERLSAHTRVRNDGKITLPLLGEVVARGQTPQALAREIEGRLRKFLNSPVVTVAVEEAHPLTVTVLGEVAHAGIFTLAPNAGVLQALAAAGGFTEFADKERVFVMRMDRSIRVRFTYSALTRAEGRAARFVLLTGDVITVE